VKRRLGWQGWQGFLDRFRPVSAAECSEGSVASVAIADVADVADAMFADEAVIEAVDSELLEFLSADLDPAEADPVFMEKLRAELWSLVQGGIASRAKQH
jgi:hypothetical protein